MLVDLIVEDDRWASIGLDSLAETAVGAALRDLGHDPDACEVALLACDDARISTLNADYRDKPTATNVLSWPAFEIDEPAPGAQPVLPPDAAQEAEHGPLFLGDIAISYDTCLAESETGGIALAQHTTHLLVHATLHLLGYDHIRDPDATLMESSETRILGKLGQPDPYKGM